jgi:hypothetical protein
LPFRSAESAEMNAGRMSLFDKKQYRDPHQLIVGPAGIDEALGVGMLTVTVTVVVNTESIAPIVSVQLKYRGQS